MTVYSPRLLQEPRWKCVRRVSLAAQWRWRRSWASRATRRSKLPSPGLAPTYNPPSNRDMTTLTVSKHTQHKLTHTWTAATFQATLCRWLVSLQQHLCCMNFDGRSHLPVYCPERRHSVCVHRPVHLSLIVSAPCLIVPPPPTPLPSRETCTLPDGPHTFSDLVFPVLPVPLCVSTCVYACKYWDQVSLGVYGNMQ